MRTPLSALLVLSVLASARPAAAEPGSPPPPSSPSDRAEADRLVADATRHFEAGRLAEALDGFRRAHALAPDRKLLFAMAKLEVELGDCAAAIAHLEAFLALEPGPRAAEAARQDLAACGSALPPPAPEPPPAERTPAPALAPAPAPAALATGPVVRLAPRPWYTDVVGDALVGAGSAALVTGGVFWALSWRSQDQKASTDAEHQDLVERADRQAITAVVAGGIGAALVVGGIVRYATRDRERRIDVAASPVGREGWGLAVGGHF